MDATIVAALVAVPTALVAAGAAYAAGRRAHAGAVDAVRRPQQREAYLRLSEEARTYLAGADRATIYHRHWPTPDPSDPDLRLAALGELIVFHTTNTEAFEPVQKAQTLVALEGAKKVARASRELLQRLEELKAWALNDAFSAAMFLMDVDDWLVRDAEVMPNARRSLEKYENTVNRHLNRLL
ncbi:hypothetical protein [Streptomyces sp. NPDC001076]